MKTNKQTKQAIASVTSGEWATHISGKPLFYWYAYGRHSLYGMFSDLGTVSIKASEVK